MRYPHLVRRGVGGERVQHVVLARYGELDEAEVLSVMEEPVADAAALMVRHFRRAPVPRAAPAIGLYRALHVVFLAQAADAPVLHAHDDFPLAL